MKKSVLFFVVFAAILVIPGCVEELVVTSKPEEMPDVVKVVFNVRAAHAPGTRSSIAVSEDAVRDINLYMYSDGILEDWCYVEGKDAISMNLRANAIYDFYALANVGEFSPPLKEEDLASLSYAVTSADGLKDVLPMAWSQKGVSPGGLSCPITVGLVRLVSKIHFSLDKSGLAGLKVKSVRLMQSALDVYPFSVAADDRLGSAATSVGDCDYASADDLVRLNEGESIFFYALENCRGTLLPDNDDEWAKTPENVGEEADMCTYVEVECEFDEGFMYEGNVTYRFYAGMDNTTNFDVVRNTDVMIKLFVTGSGIRHLSWRVDSGVGVRPGYACGFVRNGLHDQSDLYVGEVFEYGIGISEELLNDCGGKLEACSVCFVADGNDEPAISFGAIALDGSNTSGTAVGRCVSDAHGEIWLYGSDGRKIVRLCDDVLVSRPGMKLSYVSTAEVNDKVEPLDEPLFCRINGGRRYVYAYCVDSGGKNLNSSRAYGYDLSLFDFRGSVLATEFGIDSCISIDVDTGEEVSGGYAARFAYSVENDGRDVYMNSNMVNSLFTMDAAELNFAEANFGASSSERMELGYCTVILTLVDNGWAKYHDTQLSLIVDNPSNLPLKINLWEVIKGNKHIAAVAQEKELAYRSDLISCRYIPYISSVYFDKHMDLFGTGLNIECARDGSGDFCLSRDHLMIYPVSGVNTDYIRTCIKGIDNSQGPMYHLLDVTALGHSISDVEVVNKLSDGSMKYEIIYGNDPEYGGGWDERGMWLYSNNLLAEKPEASLDSYPDLTPDNLADMEYQSGLGPMEVTVSYNSGYLYANVKNNRKGVSVDVLISGKVDGEVTTHPNGTWGAAKNNYCSKSFSGEKMGVRLSGAQVRIDDGSLKSAIDGVYATTFFDSKNWMGSSNNYQHSAHPTSITLKIKVKLSKGTKGMYPIILKFANSTVPYYHAQDGQTYTVTFSPSSELSLFGLAQKK